MRLILFLFIIVTLILPKPLFAKEWRLALCYGKDATEVDKKYRNIISDIAANVFSLVDSDAELTFMARDCKKEPDFACYADTSAIYCREEPLALITRISAWLSAEAAFIYLSHKGESSVLNQVPKLSWVDALLLADAEKYDDDKVFTRRGETIIEKRDLSAKNLNAIYSLVNDIYSHTNNNIELDTKNHELMIAMDIYQAINEYAFSFLLGHESYHFNENICQITKRAAIEVNGTWNEIYKLQLKKGLFDNKVTLDKHELNADLCGFKWMEAKSSKEEKANSHVLNAMSKRIAIDLLASPMLTGALNSFDVNELGQDAPKVKIVDGYLYPQSRLVLASATLQLSEKFYPETVKVCNDTAKAIVSMVNYSYQTFPKSSGQIPDSLLKELPPGVEKYWNGAPWSEDSYACKVKELK